MTELRCVSLMFYWKDFVHRKLCPPAFGCLRPRGEDYLKCNDIVQCVDVRSYLFTMMTLFCLSDSVLSFNIFAEHVVSFLFFSYLFFSFLHLINLSMASAFLWC